jgi:DNA-binding NarL/FixJ family response regulator
VDAKRLLQQIERKCPMSTHIANDQAFVRGAMRDISKEWKSQGNVVGLPTVRPISSDREGFANAMAELRNRCPLVTIVVLATRQDWDNFAKELETAISSSIPNTVNDQIVLSALKIRPKSVTNVAPDRLTQTPGTARGPTPERAAPGRHLRSPAEAGLTPRQVEVLALMSQGKSNKAICRILNLAVSTVKNHITTILRVLNVTNRTEAAVAVNDLGWQLPPPGGIIRA